VTTLIFAVLPWLSVLACPLMMFWMMRGMSGANGHNGPANADAAATGVNEEIRQLKTRLAELESGKQETEARK
jgi:hypothetical protein